MIAQLFPRREHHIKDSFDFKQKIDAVSLRDNDVMVSMDIVSMYTSIPTELVISLIVSQGPAVMTVLMTARQRSQLHSQMSKCQNVKIQNHDAYL